MDFRKLISIWALLALMLGQVALAQHSASHIDHGFSQEITASHDLHDDNDHQHDQDNKKHECPECLITKSLQTAFYNTSITLFFTSGTENLALLQQSSMVVSAYYNPNTPRAPPALLI